MELNYTKTNLRFFGGLILFFVLSFIYFTWPVKKPETNQEDKAKYFKTKTPSQKLGVKKCAVRGSLLTGAVHLFNLLEAELLISNEKLFESLTHVKQFTCYRPKFCFAQFVRGKGFEPLTSSTSMTRSTN